MAKASRIGIFPGKKKIMDLCKDLAVSILNLYLFIVMKNNQMSSTRGLNTFQYIGIKCYVALRSSIMKEYLMTCHVN